MSKTRVLMLGWEFPPLINGGLGIACQGLANALGPKVQLDIILPKCPQGLQAIDYDLIGLNNLSKETTKKLYSSERTDAYHSRYEVSMEMFPYESRVGITAHQDVESRQTSTSAKLLVDNPFKSGPLYGEDIILKVQEYGRIVAEIAENLEFDIIHAHDWMTFSAAMALKQKFNKPLVVHIHSLQYDRVGPEVKGWVYELERQCMELADKVLPVSHYTGNIVKGHYHIDENKVIPVYNGAIFAEKFKNENPFPEKLVLFLGRITGQKGPEIFLEIADRVLRSNPKVRFVMAGTGDRMKKLIETGAYKQVGNRFHFTGFLSKDKVQNLLSKADVYCMPSVSEPFGLSALEAAQFHIPMVLSKQSGAAEVMSGALIADHWDVDLMAQHINNLLDSKELRDEAVSKNLEDLKHLTWDHAADQVLDVYEKLF